MNKGKIMGLSDRLNEIVDEANRHPNGTPSCITWDKAVYAIEALSKEVNSKPVMPKVFDEWVDYVGTSGEEALADSFNTLLFWGLYRDEPEENLFKWITNHSKSSLERTLRLSKCIDAIRYGYEVEK